MFTVALFMVAKDMETTEVSFNRCLDEENVVHIGNETLPSYKKRWNIAICDNMDGPWEYHVKQNKSERKGQELYDFIHRWDRKLKETNEPK